MSFIQCLFDVFSALLLVAAFLVVTTRHPVRAVSFLIVAFLASAGLWMLLEAEFLSLVLLFVYVGAVMMLFLFVVMMLNIDKLPVMRGRLGGLLMGGMAGSGLLAILLYGLNRASFGLSGQAALAAHPADYSHTQVLGEVLYTHYVLSFELAGVILLVAIIAAVALTFRGARRGTQHQDIAQQIAVRPEDRLRIINNLGP